MKSTNGAKSVDGNDKQNELPPLSSSSTTTTTTPTSSSYENHQFFNGYTNHNPFQFSSSVFSYLSPFLMITNSSTMNNNDDTDTNTLSICDPNRLSTATATNNSSHNHTKVKKVSRQLQKFQQEQLKELQETLQNTFTFDQLIDRERHRIKQLKKTKEILKKHLYLRLKGTVLPHVFVAWEFWLALTVFFFARILISMEIVSIHGAFYFDSSLMTVIGSFLTFLLVFYNNQIYTRFITQYEHSVKIQGRIYNATYLIRDFILLNPAFKTTISRSSNNSSNVSSTKTGSDGSQKRTSQRSNRTSNTSQDEEEVIIPVTAGIAWQLIRYLNGLHLICYIGLSDTYNYQNFFLPVNSNLILFTEEESKRLQLLDMENNGDVVCRELLAWIMTILHDLRIGYSITTEVPSAVEESMDNNNRSMQPTTRQAILRLEGDIYAMLKNEMFEIRQHVAALYDYHRQPIAFVYIHLIHGLVLVYLPLFAFYIATTFDAGMQSWGTIPALIVLGIVCVFTIGLLEIGNMMAEPYGKDYSDLNVMSFVKDTMHHCRRIMTGRFYAFEKGLSVSGCELECQLEEKRPVYGPGFRRGDMLPTPLQDSSRGYSNDTDPLTDDTDGTPPPVQRGLRRRQSTFTSTWLGDQHQHDTVHAASENQQHTTFSPLYVDSSATVDGNTYM